MNRFGDALERLRTPPVLMVVLGLALYPFVRDEPRERVLALSEAQALRAAERARTRSDAPETEESQRAAFDEALVEEALAEYAIAHELHRDDDALRGSLAEVARRVLSTPEDVATPAPRDLEALLEKVPLEPLVVATPTGANAGGIPGGFRTVGPAGLREVEVALGVESLQMPGDEPLHVTTKTRGGVALALVLTRYTETESERRARAQPELERRFAEQREADRRTAVVDALFRDYARVVRP